MKEENLEHLIKQAFASKKKKEMSAPQEAYTRAKCPSEEILCDYLGSRLAQEERERIDGHLSQCLFCRTLIIGERVPVHGEETKISHQYPEIRKDAHPVEIPMGVAVFAKRQERKQESYPQPVFGEIVSALARPIRISLRWIKGQLTLKETEADYLPFWESLSTVMIRGGSGEKGQRLPTFSKNFGDFKGEVRVIEEEEGGCEIQVRIFPLSDVYGKGRRIEFIEEGRIIKAYTLENDTVSFPGIRFGTYSIRILEGGDVKAQFDLAIEKEQRGADEPSHTTHIKFKERKDTHE